MTDYCSVDNCVQRTMPDGHLCVSCFEKKWGPNPIRDVPFPSCLLAMVAGFFSLEDYGKNWQLLYFGLRFCLLMPIADAVSFETKQKNHSFWSFVVDRYCRMQTLWTYLKDPYACLLPDNLPAAKVLVLYYPVRLSCATYEQICWQKTDDVLWWILNTNCPLV